MWESDHKESWEPKNWCFWIVVLEKTLESPLDCKQIKTVNPKGNQPWIFIGMIDAEAPILWSPDAKSWLTGKDPWCWGRLRAGGEEGKREGDGWMASLTQWTWVWASSGRELQGSRRAAIRGVTESQMWLSDWTMNNYTEQREAVVEKELQYVRRLIKWELCLTRSVHVLSHSVISNS